MGFFCTFAINIIYMHDFLLSLLNVVWMGLGFAIIRPTAALVTGVCGGLLVNRLVREDDVNEDVSASCQARLKSFVLQY